MVAALVGLTRGLKVFLVVDLVLVVVFGVMAILMLGGDGGDTAAGPSSPAGTSTTAATGEGAATVPEQDPSTDEAQEFASPTGNISCTMSTDQVSCSIANITAPPAVEGCTSAGAGHVITLTTDGVSIPCAEAVPSTAGAGVEALEYGRSQSVGEYTCTSASNGMTCVVDASGVGFRLATAGVTELS